MKKYVKEIGIFLIHLLLFYGYPLTFNGDTYGEIWMVIALGTLLLSVGMGGLSDKKLKFFYPLAVAVAAVPCVWMYFYRGMILVFFYLGASAAGVLIGAGIRWMMGGSLTGFLKGNLEKYRMFIENK